MKYNLFIIGNTPPMRVAEVETAMLPRIGDVITYQRDEESAWLRVNDVRHHVVGSPDKVSADTISIGVHTEPYRLRDLLAAMDSPDPVKRAAFAGAMEDQSLEGLTPDFTAGLMSPREVADIYEAYKRRMGNRL